MRLVPLVALGLLTSCATLPTAEPARPQAQQPARVPPAGDAVANLASITYSTSRCMGGCPVFAVTVTADGRGSWEGQRYVAALGEQAFAVSPTQFAAFAGALAPHRPSGDRRLVTQAECRQFATDMNGVDIVWTDRAGKRDVLSAYFGCDMEANRAMFEDLRAAIRALPLAALIGPAAL